MTPRSKILKTYRDWLSEAWQDRKITNDEIRLLKIYAAVHRLTVEEHEAATSELEVDRSWLSDESNIQFSDWLRKSQSVPKEKQGGIYPTTLTKTISWKKKIPPLALRWQNIVAGIAGLGLIVSIVVVILTLIV
jgi:hypothetical protein